MVLVILLVIFAHVRLKEKNLEWNCINRMPKYYTKKELLMILKEMEKDNKELKRHLSEIYYHCQSIRNVIDLSDDSDDDDTDQSEDCDEKDNEASQEEIKEDDKDKNKNKDEEKKAEMNVDQKSSNDYIFFNCPHCGIEIEVAKNEINCKIFRCGTFKCNGLPIPPHLDKATCDKLKETDVIYGCGMPMKLVDNNTKVEKCDYI